MRAMTSEAPAEMPDDRSTPVATAEISQRLVVEARWPIALVVGTYLAITIGLRIAVPERPTLGPTWLVPSIEALLLVARDLPAHVLPRQHRGETDAAVHRGEHQ